MTSEAMTTIHPMQAEAAPANASTKLILARREFAAAQVALQTALHKESTTEILAAEAVEHGEQLAQIDTDRTAEGVNSILEDREPDYSEVDQKKAALDAAPVSPKATAANNAMPALRNATSEAREALALARERLARAEFGWLAAQQDATVADLHRQLEDLAPTLAKMAALDALIPSSGPFHVHKGAMYAERLSAAFFGRPLFMPSWANRRGADLPGYSSAMQAVRDDLTRASEMETRT